jgi:hypothetical protein
VYNAISGTEMQVDVVAALPAGSNAIGKLAANTGVDIGDVDVTSISAGSNLIGDVGISGARTSGGATHYRNIDVDETEDAIKASAGQVYFIQCTNLDATVIYLHFYDAGTGSVCAEHPEWHCICNSYYGSSHNNGRRSRRPRRKRSNLKRGVCIRNMPGIITAQRYHQHKPWWHKTDRNRKPMDFIDKLAPKFQAYCRYCRDEVDYDTEQAKADHIWVFRKRCLRCGGIIAHGVMQTEFKSPRPLPQKVMSFIQQRGIDRR